MFVDWTSNEDWVQSCYLKKWGHLNRAKGQQLFEKLEAMPIRHPWLVILKLAFWLIPTGYWQEISVDCYVPRIILWKVNSIFCFLISLKHKNAAYSAFCYHIQYLKYDNHDRKIQCRACLWTFYARLQYICIFYDYCFCNLLQFIFHFFSSIPEVRVELI